jgi:hypothetical protein
MYPAPRRRLFWTPTISKQNINLPSLLLSNFLLGKDFCSCSSLVGWKRHTLRSICITYHLQQWQQEMSGHFSTHRVVESLERQQINVTGLWEWRDIPRCCVPFERDPWKWPEDCTDKPMHLPFRSYDLIISLCPCWAILLSLSTKL